MKLNSFIIHILDRFGSFEKVSEGGLVGLDSAQYSEGIERSFSKLTVMLDNCNETVCYNCNIYLYSHSVLAGSLKGKNTNMLFYPLEEKLYLPSLLVEHCNIPSLDCKVICKECERPCYSLALGKVDHVVGKLLKNTIISVGISIRQIAQLYVSVTETEMVALTLDGVNDCRNFSEAVTARKLSEHHDKELIPTGEMLHPLITFVSFYNAIKDSFRKKTNELTEYVFACIHTNTILVQSAKLQKQFKSTRGVFCYI